MASRSRSSGVGAVPSTTPGGRVTASSVTPAHTGARGTRTPPPVLTVGSAWTSGGTGAGTPRAYCSHSSNSTDGNRPRSRYGAACEHQRRREVATAGRDALKAGRGYLDPEQPQLTQQLGRGRRQ